jgi:hypothetical protein
MSSSAEVEVPTEWEEVARGGSGPFTTWIEYRGPDQAHHVWSARTHRKGHGPRRTEAAAGSGYRAYDRLAWWIAVLFQKRAVGSWGPLAVSGAALAFAVVGRARLFTVLVEVLPRVTAIRVFRAQRVQLERWANRDGASTGI